MLYRLSRKNEYTYPTNKVLVDMIDVSISTVIRSLKILKEYHLISIKKIPSENGGYSQRRIYVHTNLKKETDDSTCISLLVSNTSHNSIKEKYH